MLGPVRLPALALAALALVAGILWWRLTDRRAAAVAEAQAARLASASGRTAPLPAPLPAEAPPSGPRNRDPHWGQDDSVSDDPLATYIHASRYPPSSRPLGPQNDDLLSPNKRHEDPTQTKDGRVRYRFSADRYFVVGDERLEVFLEVQDNARIAITTSFVAALEPGHPFESLVRIPFELAPGASGLYTASLRPSALPLPPRAAEVGVYVAFDHGGAAPEKASFVFHYTPARAVPARFTGQFRDALRGGSLVVEAGVRVEQPGYYLIDCNLYDHDGHPLAWTRFTGDLAAGDTFVPLSFFGKVLRDAAAPSPYAIGQLRGERHVLGRDPDADRMPAFEGRYSTRAYALSEISDAEWDDDSRRRRIERLRDQQASGPKHFGPR
jgi:hypothetical protein